MFSSSSDNELYGIFFSNFLGKLCGFLFVSLFVFFYNGCHFIIFPTVEKDSLFSIFFLTLVHSCLFNDNSSTDMWQYLIVVLMSICWALFHMSVDHLYIYFGKKKKSILCSKTFHLHCITPISIQIIHIISHLKNEDKRTVLSWSSFSFKSYSCLICFPHFKWDCLNTVHVQNQDFLS